MAQRTVPGSCPLDCPDACAWEVTVDEANVPVRIRGRSDHPFTQGGLCPKVNPWLTHAADDSRLTHPLRRTGPKGSGQFEPVSWDDAIAEMADRLQTVIDQHGGAAVWPFHGTGNLGWLQGSNGPGRVWTRMGASAHNMSICAVAGNVGMQLTVGVGDWMDAEEFDRSGIVLVWGSNTLISNRHLWPFIEKARRERGAPLIVIDPIRTRTAENADLHLSPRPGTDGALALSICAELIRRGAADQSFISDRTLGWSDFSASVSAWTLGRASEVTGIPVSELDRLVQLLMRHGPLGLRIGHGMQRHAGGGQAMRSISCIPAVVGAYDEVGGGALYSGSAMHKGYNLEQSRRPALGHRPRTLVMTNLGRNLTELSDPPVDALVVWGANPVVSNPQTDLVLAGLGREDLFTVVIDIHQTETTDWADLVLPSTMQHEQYELNDSYNHRRLHWNEPASTPVGACLPHTEIFRRLATAMGYDEPELQADDLELIDDLLDNDHMRSAGITTAALAAAGHMPLPLRAAPDMRSFRTPSGRFEFVSTSAEADGYGRLPHFVPGREASAVPDDHLALIAAASEHHVNSTFAGTAHTRARTGEPPLLLHPEDAAPRNLSDGDRVLVYNERGSFEAVLQVNDRTPPGVANSTKGWWHHRLNATVDERDADMGGGAVFHDNAVLVRRVEPPGN